MSSYSFEQPYSPGDLDDEGMRKRVCEEMTKQGFSQASLSKATGLGRGEVSKIVNGVRPPTVRQLKTLVPALDTSVEYIVTGKKTQVHPLPDNGEGFPERFKKLLDLRSVSLIGVCVQVIAETGIDSVINIATLSRLKNGGNLPNLVYLYLLSRFFRCSMDYLLGVDKMIKQEPPGLI